MQAVALAIIYTSFSSCFTFCRCYITATPFRHAKREDTTNNDTVGSMFPMLKCFPTSEKKM